ncbi:hypothetical protein SaSA201_1814 [Streptococcus agalactiae]|nr:hypothetical protein SaSA30_1814 [Streptococcus agalactiae]AUO82834.1 hypothetical protein SaSA33_1811 [Streptococcus agalactiae]AUO86115.1 hypothetical protein SaSA73_1818 [Streptococcus agalactiae]AUO87770.1 hypothetical protein SaSA1_1816 [Streptococcus agalactiae]AUO89424.1 hypothetical protein SaSA5_1812 [Streptococcus agalactiae]
MDIIVTFLTLLMRITSLFYIQKKVECKCRYRDKSCFNTNL